MNRYTFKLGDIVYYLSPIAEFSVKRARIAEIKMRKLRGSPVIETVDKIIMDNGDEVAIKRYIVCYLMAKSEHDDSKLYWQMVDKRQLNEETETIIKNQS